MLVRIGASNAVWISVDAEPQWSATATQALGACKLVIPRDSAAWDTDVLDERGGFLVEIVSPVGLWRGVADAPQWKPGAGMEVSAVALSVWLEDRKVGAGLFSAVTAGAIFREAFRQALAGLGAPALLLGSVLYAPPLVPEYVFNRQSVLDVLRDLTEQTGQEWMLDDRGRLHWLHHEGQYHDLPPIVDDGRLFPRLAPGTLDDGANQVIEIGPGDVPWTAYSDDPRPLRPRVTVER